MIRFAMFVICDVAKNGCNIADGVMGGDFVVDGRRTTIKEYLYFYNDLKEKDDWNLNVGYIFPFVRKAYLNRGPNRVKIVLTKQENKAMIEIWDEAFARLKKAQLLAKQDRQAEERRMQDWP